jgi:hypothetical protein
MSERVHGKSPDGLPERAESVADNVRVLKNFAADILRSQDTFRAGSDSWAVYHPDPSILTNDIYKARAAQILLRHRQVSDRRGRGIEVRILANQTVLGKRLDVHPSLANRPSFNIISWDLLMGPDDTIDYYCGNLASSEVLWPRDYPPKRLRKLDFSELAASHVSIFRSEANGHLELSLRGKKGVDGFQHDDVGKVLPEMSGPLFSQEECLDKAEDFLQLLSDPEALPPTFVSVPSQS